MSEGNSTDSKDNDT